MNGVLTYATVCSGVECMSAAAQGLPLAPVFFAEVEPFPCAVIRARFPAVPNLGDVSGIQVKDEGRIATNGSSTVAVPGGRLDILAGGTPCQDVSVAGRRAGMREGSGTRSSLAFEFVRLARELRPRWIVWENVAGVLSDPSFPAFLAALAQCGYGVGYRTLDAQYVRVDGLERAVPQRRRRVWGASFTLNAVERHAVAFVYGAGSGARSLGIGEDESPTLSRGGVPAVASRYTLRRLTPLECERLMGLPDGWTIPVGLRRFFVDGAPAPALVAEFRRIFDAFGAIVSDHGGKPPPKPRTAAFVSAWLTRVSDPAACPDAPRYKACGNGWAVNQPRWILTRLLAAEGIDWQDFPGQT